MSLADVIAQIAGDPQAPYIIQQLMAGADPKAFGVGGGGGPGNTGGGVGGTGGGNSGGTGSGSGGSGWKQTNNCFNPATGKWDAPCPKPVQRGPVTRTPIPNQHKPRVVGPRNPSPHPAVCPPGMSWSDQFRQCIPECPPGQEYQPPTRGERGGCRPIGGGTGGGGGNGGGGGAGGGTGGGGGYGAGNVGLHYPIWVYKGATDAGIKTPPAAGQSSPDWSLLTGSSQIAGDLAPDATTGLCPDGSSPVTVNGKQICPQGYDEKKCQNLVCADKSAPTWDGTRCKCGDGSVPSHTQNQGSGNNPPGSGGGPNKGGNPGGGGGGGLGDEECANMVCPDGAQPFWSANNQTCGCAGGGQPHPRTANDQAGTPAAAATIAGTGTPTGASAASKASAAPTGAAKTGATMAGTSGWAPPVFQGTPWQTVESDAFSGGVVPNMTSQQYQQLLPFLDVMSGGYPALVAKYGLPDTWGGGAYQQGQFGLPTWGGFQFTGAQHEFGGNPALANLFMQGGATPDDLARFLIQAQVARANYSQSPAALAALAAGQDIWGNPLNATAAGSTAGAGAGSGSTGSGGGNAATPPGNNSGTQPAPSSVNTANTPPSTRTVPFASPSVAGGGGGGFSGESKGSGFDSLIQELLSQWNGKQPPTPATGGDSKPSLGGGSREGFTNEESFQ